MDGDISSWNVAGSFFSPNRIIFGNGESARIGPTAKLFGVKRAIIIVDSALNKGVYMDAIRASLIAEGLSIDVYEKEGTEPTSGMVDRCTAHVRKHRFDLVVGLGGGSVMDMTKMVSIMATNTGKILDYEGLDRVPRRGIPKIMIPTTAGSGAEVTRMAGVIDEAGKRKCDVSSTYNLADAVILDPYLTMSLPKDLTARIGIDGLSHAIESCVARGATPFSEITALEAIRLVAGHLPTACACGDDLESRSRMLFASTLAGLALGPGKLGAVHGLAFALEVVSGLPHAACITIMIAPTMETNLKGNPGKFASIAQAMGRNTEGLTPLDAAKESVTAVRDLISRLGISTRLADYGLSRDNLPEFIDQALSFSAWFEPNPTRLDRTDMEEIFMVALA